MRSFARLTLSLAVLMFGAASLEAQYVQAYKIDNAAKNQPESEVFTVMSAHLGVSADTLKAEKAESGLGLGQLYIAHSLAKATKTDVKAMLNENKTKSWGEIAKEKHVNMKDIENDAEKLEKELKAHSKTAAASKKGIDAQTK
jgi:hypothetical protein